MADIQHEIVDGCAVFTGVSERGRAWMVATRHESLIRYALTNDGIEQAQAERFLREARQARLVVDTVATT